MNYQSKNRKVAALSSTLLAVGTSVITVPAFAGSTQVTSLNASLPTFIGSPYSSNNVNYSQTVGSETFTFTHPSIYVFSDTFFANLPQNGQQIFWFNTPLSAAPSTATISFSQPLSEIEFAAEVASSVTHETFDFTAYNGINPIGTYNISGISNMNIKGGAPVVGVLANGGDQITKLVIKSTPSAVATGFAISPIRYGVGNITATPEPSTLATLGISGLGLLGLLLRARKRSASV